MGQHASATLALGMCCHPTSLHLRRRRPQVSLRKIEGLHGFVSARLAGLSWETDGDVAQQAISLEFIVTSQQQIDIALSSWNQKQ
jgi:hypothetical protein